MPSPARIYLFITPFASPAARQHALKLLHCLTPSPFSPSSSTSSPCSLYALCDRRLNLTSSSLPIIHIPLPPLRYLDQCHPSPLSPLLWLFNLLRILFFATCHLLRLAPRLDLVVCALGCYYTPILLTARFLRKKTLIFEPGGEYAAAQSAYHHTSFWSILSLLLRFLTALNRRLSSNIVIESPAVIPFAGLEPFRGKIRLASLYIDPIFSAPHAPTSPSPPTRPPVVGFMGRLSPEKGILSLLDAARLLDPREAAFFIAGDGPLRSEVERRLASPQLHHVRYIGWLSSADIPAFLYRLTLFVLPSAGEGIPNAVLEAMACGVPVLAAPVGGLPDLLHDGSTGYLLPDTSPQSIADCIRHVLSDPSLPSVARRAQCLVLRRYSLAASRRNWRFLLAELLATP